MSSSLSPSLAPLFQAEIPLALHCLQTQVPASSPLFRVLNDRFERTKSSAHKDISHADLKIVGIRYSFTANNFLQFQRKLQYPDNVKLVCVCCLVLPLAVD